MGIGAIAKPALVPVQFGILELTPAGRNEVRAVYGGSGLFMALALLVALRQPALRDGILSTVGVALGGMAAGRLVAAVARSTHTHATALAEGLRARGPPIRLAGMPVPF